MIDERDLARLSAYADGELGWQDEQELALPIVDVRAQDDRRQGRRERGDGEHAGGDHAIPLEPRAPRDGTHEKNAGCAGRDEPDFGERDREPRGQVRPREVR